jgi:O-antigen/teichoic acid export membrane protein
MFAGLLMPALTAAVKNGGDEFPRVLGNAVDAASIYGVGAILGLAVFAPQVLTLLAGVQFASGAPALIIIAFAVALAAMTHILRFTLVACDKSRLVFIADAVACTFAFVAYFSLIPRFSLIGAATGTVVAEICALVGMLYGLKRAGRSLPSFRNPAKAIFSGAVAAAAMMLPARLALPWFIALLIGGAVYLGGLALTHAIPRELVLSVLRRRRVAYQGSA